MIRSKASTHTDWQDAHVNELLLCDRLKPENFPIFSKKWQIVGGLRYLLFVSFIHHLPTTFIPSGIAYP